LYSCLTRALPLPPQTSPYTPARASGDAERCVPARRAAKLRQRAPGAAAATRNSKFVAPALKRRRVARARSRRTPTSGNDSCAAASSGGLQPRRVSGAWSASSEPSPSRGGGGGTRTIGRTTAARAVAAASASTPRATTAASLQLAAAVYGARTPRSAGGRPPWSGSRTSPGVVAQPAWMTPPAAAVGLLTAVKRTPGSRVAGAHPRAPTRPASARAQRRARPRHGQTLL
jgi:hypothetical protein